MGFQVGQRVADYEIVSLLGVGGMGCVYQVRNVISHRTEAMKVLLADLKAEADLASRFVSEIRTLATLDHPNIAQLHTALQTSNELVMLMEFVDGLTLQQMARQNPLSLEDVVNYMHQVLAALSFAHSRGVVHRDVKPANIMVTSQGVVKLTDFGIAKSKVRDELTRPGTTVGSLNYMSPEQALGGGAVDGRSDIYSVGITMYELLAGRRPFEDESAYVVLHSQLNAIPRPPCELNPSLSQELNDLILKTLEKDPAKRFQSAAELSDALLRATGIAASTQMHRVSNHAPATGVAKAFSIPAAIALAPASVVSSPARRRLMIASASLAILGVPVVTAVGLPHLVKGGTMLKTANHAVTRSSTLITPPHAAVSAKEAARDAVTTAVAANAITTNDKSPLSAMAGAQPQPHLIPATSNPRERFAPKVSRVEYATASLPEGPAKTEPSLPAPTSAALQEVYKQRVELDARAAIVRMSVQHLKTQREAAGESLSEDIAGAYVRMNTYLNAEKMDLEDGDVASAHDHLDKAASEVATLESLFKK